MIRILEEKCEKKKLYKYTTIKLRVPKNMEFDMIEGRVEPLPKVSIDNGIATIVFKQLLSSDRKKK